MRARRSRLTWRHPLAWGLALALGCDREGEAASRSRVQAVLAEPGAESRRPAAEPDRARSTRASPGAAPAALGGAGTPSARPALCAGQLGARPEPFRPRRAPTQLSLAPGEELARDPLQAAPGRWLWINFWAAWCVPCKQELPLLRRWQRDLGDQLELRFISLDDDERQLRDFLAREPSDGLIRTYWLPEGPARRAWLDALGLASEPELPLQLLLDEQGRLRCRVRGAVEPEDRAALEQIIGG